jgi:general secretion pathway protein F
VAAFDYVALDGSGKQKKGILEGDSARQVRQSLRDQGLTPLSVDAAAKTGGSGRKSFSFSSGPSLKIRELALVTRQMATLVNAALPLEEVLGAVAQQTEKPATKSLLMAVRSKILEGYTLADSMGEFPKAFPKLYRATISAGEHSGHLDLVMNRLADYTESSHDTRRSLTAALVYPSILLLVSIGIVIFLMISVVPGVLEVFSDNNQQLPLITTLLVTVSDFLSSWYLYLLLGLAGLVIGFKLLMRNADIRLRYHHKLLDLPVVGKLYRTIETARFASTLSILTSSGVALVDAMKIAGEVLSNDWLRTRVQTATRNVSEGASLKNSLEQAGYFPPMMLHMIASGESSGELDAMLDKTARAQELDLANFVNIMVSVIPPLIILVMGGMVFCIVLAILLPIFQLNQLVI